MRNFFKIFFASLLAIFVTLILLIVTLVFLINAAASDDAPLVKDKTVLYIDISKPVEEQGGGIEFNFPDFNADPTPGIRDYILAVEHAATDTSVKAIYLMGRGNAMGFAASQEFGKALDVFRESGKPIFASGAVMSQRAYEITHRASHLFLQPGGIFEWTGYNIELMFFKNALDKLAIEPEIFYAGQFKGATEPYRVTKMSDANRLQYQVFLEGIYGQFLQSVASHRGLDSNQLVQLANQLAISSPDQALQAGLIDGVLYEDEVRDSLRSLIGIKKGNDIPFMDIAKYSETVPKTGSGDRIALVYADGAIVDGKGETGEVAADAFRAFLSEIRNDEKIKAVVLRINSPGGSAIASELIWRELSLIQKEKPLVVSMGEYAASGGYYIATMADSIFAMPNTLTGSIGVFSVYFNAKQLLNEKLGLTFDGVRTTEYADFGTATRPMSAFEKQVAQRDVDTTYALFKSRVVAGRKLAPAKVDSIAQGRVWTGTDALQIGLIDRIGSLEDAIACAGRMAKAEKYTLRTYPEVKSIFERLMDNSDPNTTEMKLVEKHMGTAATGWVKEIRQISKMANQTQMRMPFIPQLP
jgi:protease-4